jgi:predicted RNA-binding protein with PUA-like domain
MKYWLLKTEPSDYSWDDLVRDRSTAWDGIGNNAALLHLRAAAKGDRCVIYQTGKDKSAMGLAVITTRWSTSPATAGWRNRSR